MKNIYVMIRLTADEMKKIRAAAQLDDRTVSSWCHCSVVRSLNGTSEVEVIVQKRDSSGRFVKR